LKYQHPSTFHAKGSVMNVLLVNWKNGENDPFSFFNSHLKDQLIHHGCNVYILELDDQFLKNLFSLLERTTIHIAITHQGLGSNFLINENNLWEVLKIKLICLHGDHPCFAPDNHSVDSKFVLHTYSVPDFVIYANNFFKRSNPSIFVNFPFFFNFTRITPNEKANYFVFPKNLDSTEQTFDNWRNSLPKFASEFLIETSILIINDIKNGKAVDHHQVITNQLTDDNFNQLLSIFKPSSEINLFHQVHASLDKIYRNSFSELVVNELEDLPLRVNGRGWDIYIKYKNKNHVYSDISTLNSSEIQFSGNLGIIDVTAHCNALHDRMLRAIGYKTSFMTNSELPFEDYGGSEFKTIFYNGQPGDLKKKAEEILLNPRQHQEKCIELGSIIKRQYNFSDFYKFLYSEYKLTNL
jgi:hypothetical protein